MSEGGMTVGTSTCTLATWVARGYPPSARRAPSAGNSTTGDLLEPDHGASALGNTRGFGRFRRIASLGTIFRNDRERHADPALERWFL